MISTVVTSTITTITTVTAIVGLGLSLVVALGIVAVVALIVLLGTKELTSASQGSTRKFLARSLDVGIVPLGIAFAVIVAMTVMEILG